MESDDSRSDLGDYSGVLTVEIHPEASEELVVCEACGECFDSEAKRKDHECTVIPDPVRYECRVCWALFNTRDSLINHVIDTHSKTSQDRSQLYEHRRCVCPICSEVFSDEKKLTRHIALQCGMERFSCPICNKVFTNQGNLKKHVTNHTQPSRFQCQICNKCLTNRGNLTKHMMIHTGIRPFKCEQCGRAFTLRRNLKEHMLIHEGIRPYHCSTCGKTFTQLSNLNQHQLIHSGIQDYPCELCGKAFTLRGNLKKHVLIHAQEFAYRCHRCGKAFTLSGNLKKHLSSTGTKCYKLAKPGSEEHTLESLRPAKMKTNASPSKMPSETAKNLDVLNYSSDMNVQSRLDEAYLINSEAYQLLNINTNLMMNVKDEDHIRLTS